MIEQVIVSLLEASAEVGLLAGQRIYPLVIPQHVSGEAAKLPAVVYQRTGADRGLTFCATDRLVAARIQVDCYARNYGDARALGSAVRRALVDYAGVSGGVTVNRVTLESEYDGMDEDPGLFRLSQSYLAWHLED